MPPPRHKPIQCKSPLASSGNEEHDEENKVTDEEKQPADDTIILELDQEESVSDSELTDPERTPSTVSRAHQLVREGEDSESFDPERTPSTVSRAHQLVREGEDSESYDFEGTPPTVTLTQRQKSYNHNPVPPLTPMKSQGEVEDASEASTLPITDFEDPGHTPHKLDSQESLDTLNLQLPDSQESLDTLNLQLPDSQESLDDNTEDTDSTPQKPMRGCDSEADKTETIPCPSVPAASSNDQEKCESGECKGFDSEDFLGDNAEETVLTPDKPMQECPSEAVPENAKQGDDSIQVVSVKQCEIYIFKPLNNQDRRDCCDVLGISPNSEFDNVEFEGWGTDLTKSANLVCQSVLGDGNCYYNAVSWFLTGSQEHHAKIRKMVNTYIMDPMNKHKFTKVLGDESGEDYVKQNNHMQDRVWATDVQVRATAFLLQKDVYVSWADCNFELLAASGDTSDRTARGIFILHTPGHFQPIISAAKADPHQTERIVVIRRGAAELDHDSDPAPDAFGLDNDLDPGSLNPYGNTAFRANLERRVKNIERFSDIPRLPETKDKIIPEDTKAGWVFPTEDAAIKDDNDPPHIDRAKLPCDEEGYLIGYSEGSKPKSPGEFFDHVFDPEFWQTIADNTNAYHRKKKEKRTLGPKSRLHDWKEDCTTSEVKTVFGLLIAMGLVQKHNLEAYWNTTDEITTTPFFNKTMTRNRFQAIYWNLHMTASEAVDEGPESNEKHPLYKVCLFCFDRFYYHRKK